MSFYNLLLRHKILSALALVGLVYVVAPDAFWRGALGALALALIGAGVLLGLGRALLSTWLGRELARAEIFRRMFMRRGDSGERAFPVRKTE